MLVGHQIFGEQGENTWRRNISGLWRRRRMEKGEEKKFGEGNTYIYLVSGVGEEWKRKSRKMFGEGMYLVRGGEVER